MSTEDPPVEWICSHILEDKILWSSDETQVKPNIVMSDLNLGASNHVVNTWFVETPTPSNLTLDLKWKSELQRAATLITNASAVLIIAGAGIGVDSGLPDYRGPQGFWKAYPKLVNKGMSLEDMSHPDWFMKDPVAAWGFYGHRAQLYDNAKPHKGFRCLKKIVELKNENYFVFTSNIDNQFQVAGFDENKIFEAHGSLVHFQCVDEQCSEVWHADGDIPASNSDFQATGDLPNCPNCGASARPNVSMFGDTNLTWKDSRASQQKYQFMSWLRRAVGTLEQSPARRSTRRSHVADQKVVILEIGCGVSLHSLRYEAELLISLKPETVNCIRINPVNHQINGESNVGIGLGSLESLIEIAKLMGVSVDQI